MPYGLGVAIIGVSLIIVFATFAYLLVNARGLMALFRAVSDGEIKPGPGARNTSRKGAAIALIVHFVAWGVAGFAWLYLLADVRASAPDTTPLEKIEVVDGRTGAQD